MDMDTAESTLKTLMILLGDDKAAKHVPSGEKETAKTTEPVWMVTECAPENASQNRTVLSKDPDTRRVPPGEKASEARR